MWDLLTCSSLQRHQVQLLYLAGSKIKWLLPRQASVHIPSIHAIFSTLQCLVSKSSAPFGLYAPQGCHLVSSHGTMPKIRDAVRSQDRSREISKNRKLLLLLFWKVLVIGEQRAECSHAHQPTCLASGGRCGSTTTVSMGRLEMVTSHSKQVIGQVLCPQLLLQPRLRPPLAPACSWPQKGDP